MEEFKNLEEIIELCKEELENNDENVHATLDLEDLKELRNLINKYEELQKESFEDYKSYFDLVQEDNELLVQKENKIKELEKERDGIYADYQDLGKEKLRLEEKCEEQEKMIELMAKDIAKITDSCPFDMHDYQVEDCDNICSEICQFHKEYTCFIEYYEKKAKGE